ncbi:hypothetical protein Avbf_02755 [Armadillidium vulgare]|nr:hypothetical protein Avbf_02755 [Armadillidium vulgare]
MLTRIDNIPPFSTSDCGKRNASIYNMERNEETRGDISCFRACPADNSDCTFSQSIFGVKIIKNTDGKLDITMGANTGNDYNYVAMGQTEDSKTLKNSDINICYKNNTFADGSSIRFGHKFLLHLNHTFLNHEGDISLVSAFMDNESLWCRFRRPFRGSHVSRMNVDKPSYFFFFIGRYIDGEFINPNLNEIMMTSERRTLKNGLLGNEKLMLLRESEAQKLCESKFIIVTVLVVFFLL